MRFRLILPALLVLLPGATVLAQQEPPDIPPSFIYTYQRGAATDRLDVRLEVPDDNPAAGLTVSVFDERIYDPDSFDYVFRETVVLSGPGLSTTGLVLPADSLDVQQALVAALDRFLADARQLQGLRASLQQEVKPWMKYGEADLNAPRPYGVIERDGGKEPWELTFNWDFSLDRIWLGVDGVFKIEQKRARGVRTLVDNIPLFLAKRAELREELIETNRKIDRELGITLAE